MGKITLQDSEVGKMVKSLLGSEPLVTELDEFFTIHAFYTEEHTPEYLCAVIDAVAGRFGKRFIKVEDDNFHKLVKSVLTFPQMLSLRPIVIDENRIVLGGNMRTRALRYISTMEVEEMSKYLRGNKNKTHLLQEWQIWQQSKEVSIKFALGLTEEQKKEFIIKDNVAYGQWNFEALKAWEDVDLEDWGVELPEWDKPKKEVKEDDFNPDKKVKARCKFGELWQLGKHRLLCGDSTNKQDVEKLMGGGNN